MRNEQRKEKICNAILYIAVATGVVDMTVGLILAILDELRGIPEELIIKTANLGLIPIALLVLVKIIDADTKR